MHLPGGLPQITSLAANQRQDLTESISRVRVGISKMRREMVTNTAGIETGAGNAEPTTRFLRGKKPLRFAAGGIWLEGKGAVRTARNRTQDLAFCVVKFGFVGNPAKEDSIR